jgi:chemotaxis signal transduction protein
MGQALTVGQLSQQNASSEYLLFRVGKQIFAMQMCHVNYVAQMGNDFAYSGNHVESHFVFDGQPVSYISVWDKLGLESEYLEYEHLLAMLPQRLNDHVEWMRALAESLRSGAPFTKARNPYECAFGKWYYAHRSDDKRLSMLLDQFEQPHAQIHALADQLLALSAEGKSQVALHRYEEAEDTTLAMLKKLFQTTEALVAELQRRVAIIVSDEQDRCALGVDGIVDIVNVPPDRVRANNHWDKKHPVQSVTAGMLVLEDGSIAPIIDWLNFA